jgi:lipopolysaccharide export system permease protein
MRKIDKLVLKAFLGPFIMTFLVVVFILLTQHMLKYFDDIIGKDLGTEVISQLLFYFAIFMTPVAMPLAVLLSSLIAFGNLGEHFELTAIKSAGISLLRTLQPIFFFVLILTGIAFYVNNNLVPKAALEAYSLLYDIKQKKPALELREGAFYNGIPDISIKVNEKFSEDPDALKGIIVYDHRKNDGNREVTVADSGRMSTILNERYLKFELYNGYNYTEGAAQEREMTGQKNVPANETLTRSKFSKTEVVFDLSSFQLTRTDKKWFESNRIMRNLKELDEDIDSIREEVLRQRLTHYVFRSTFFLFFKKGDTLIMPKEVYAYQLRKDSIDQALAGNQPENTAERYAAKQDTMLVTAARDKLRSRINRLQQRNLNVLRNGQTNRVSTAMLIEDSVALAKLDSIHKLRPTYDVIQSATNQARQTKSHLQNTNGSVENYSKELAVFKIQWHKILASSLACVAMFLIGAPLGAIIKRGGLGVPFLVSILFFIVYYLLSMQGEKLAKQETVSAVAGVWAADAVLFVIGIVFLRTARNDARLFEADFYRVMLDRIGGWLVDTWPTLASPLHRKN